MLLLVADLDVIRPRRNHIDQRRFLVELRAELVEVGHFDLGAHPHRTRVRRELAEDQAQQRGLAGAVGTDHADAVAALETTGEIAHDLLVAETLRNADQFGHQLAALFARVERQFDLALTVASRGAVPPQLFKAQHAAFVAGTPGLDTLANPDFLLRQEFVELGVLHRLVLQHLFLAHLIGAEISGKGLQNPSVEFDDARRHAVEEAPVVGDEDQRHAGREQQLFEPFDGADVKVVGRLVEQQDVGRHRQRLRQGQAFLLSARQRADLGVGIERKTLDHPFGLRLERPGIARFQLALQPMQAFEQGLLTVRGYGHRMRNLVVFGQQRRHLAHPGDNRLENAEFGIERRFLRHVAESQSRLPPHRAVVERPLPRHCAQQGGFAASVAADQRDAFARFELEIRVIKKWNMAIGQRSIGKNQMGHGEVLLFWYRVQLSEVGDDFGGVLRRIDLQVGFRDFTLRIDEERVTLGKTRHHPVCVGAVTFGHKTFAVGQQRERQMVFLREISIRCSLGDAHADDLRAERHQLGNIVAEVAGFLGTTRRVVLRIEVKHDPFAAQAFQRYLAPVLIDQGEIRRCATCGGDFVGHGNRDRAHQQQRQPQALEHRRLEHRPSPRKLATEPVSR